MVRVRISAPTARLTPYTASSSRRYDSVTAGGDGVTAVHDDGGLRAVYVW